MKLYFSQSIFIGLLSITPLKLPLIIIQTCYLFSYVQPLCHVGERISLLEFKDSFIIHRRASSNPLAYSKVSSWSPKDQKDDDCCTWDGVKCDDQNKTHVVGLYLGSSCLYGSITSNNSLFRLSHLQILDLSDNDFNHSQIPSQFGHLPGLKYLNLSLSAFAGQIPLKISCLTSLSYLDLSSNYLELKRPNLSTLVRNFRNIKHLDLSSVDISSPVPSLLANLSSLTTLILEACGLCDEFPNIIFQLPNLQHLSLSDNENLSGSFPEFHSGSPLRELWLWGTNFSGHISSSIGNLEFLHVLNVARCMLSGPLPSSLGRLSKLRSLNLNSNNLNGTVDFNLFLGMKNLTRLLLSGNELSVLIMESTGNINATLPEFEILSLSYCNLTRFPDFLRYQDNLKFLELDNNQMYGEVPKWIWNKSIEALGITANYFTGFGIDVLPSQNLRILDFSLNNFVGAVPIPPPSTTLFAAYNNELSGEISPLFLNLSSLELLDLSYNNLSGVLPECSRSNSHNISSAGAPQMCSFGSQLQMMDLSYNQFQGRLPRLMLANSTELQVLKLENNHFNDVFPSWLEILPKLRVLGLRSNHFHGAITSKSISDYHFPNLQIIDISHNNLSGLLPCDYFQNWNTMKVFDAKNSLYLGTTISLTLSAGLQYKYIYSYKITITNKGNDRKYDKILEVFTVIDLSSNRFEGDIPECIGNLEGVQVLNLSNNMLFGSIPLSMSNMTQLESLDLSRNNLTGKIPQQLVQLTFLEYFNVSFNHLRGLIPQGSQFSTFDNDSYEGNAGLWGYPWQSLTAPPEAPSSPNSDSDENGDQDSKSWFELYWMTILPGLFGGLIFGVAIEQLLEVDKCEWFFKAVDFLVFTKTKWRTRKEAVAYNLMSPP